VNGERAFPKGTAQPVTGEILGNTTNSFIET